MSHNASTCLPPLYVGFLQAINTQFQAIHKFYGTKALLVRAIGYHFFYNLANALKGLFRIEIKHFIF
jgi:hypothetical protein